MKITVALKNTALFLATLSLVIACSPAISKEAKYELSKSVDCGTAEDDIRILRSEKASVEKQVLDGATAVFPAGAVIGILTGQELDKLEIASGEYNSLIDKKICLIQNECGVR